MELYHPTPSPVEPDFSFKALVNRLRVAAQAQPASFNARQTLAQLANEWNEALPQQALTAEDLNEAISLAEYHLMGSKPRIELPDRLDAVAGVITRLVGCIGIIFAARLLAMPLAYGESIAIEWFQGGVLAFVIITAFLIWNDFRNRRVQVASSRQHFISQSFRRERELFEAAVNHLRSNLPA